MDWIRKNKFLTGVLGFVVVVAGVLGYLLFAQMGTYDQTSQDYDAAVKELDRLQGETPFPYQKSKANLVELRQKTTNQVSELQKQLADYEPPAERANFSPTEFQDKLRRVVDEVTQAARGANVELPPDFYMGFEQYRGTLPDATAAPMLSRELDAIQDLLKILITHRIDKLISIKRAPLPAEAGGGAASRPVVPPRPGAPPPLAESVSRTVLDIAFSGAPSSFRDTLDDMVNSKRLFLVRAVQVKNQSQKGPPRESSAATAQATPAPGGTPDPNAVATPDKPAITYIVGLEKLDLDMRIELVKVAPPTAMAKR